MQLRSKPFPVGEPASLQGWEKFPFGRLSSISAFVTFLILSWLSTWSQNNVAFLCISSSSFVHVKALSCGDFSQSNSMPLKSLTDDSLHLNLSFCNLFLHLQNQLNEDFCLIVSSNQLWVHKCEQGLNQIYGHFDLSYIYWSKYVALSSRQMLSGHLGRVLHHPLPDVRLDFCLFPV